MSFKKNKAEYALFGITRLYIHTVREKLKHFKSKIFFFRTLSLT